MPEDDWNSTELKIAILKKESIWQSANMQLKSQESETVSHIGIKSLKFLSTRML